MSVNGVKLIANELKSFEPQRRGDAEFIFVNSAVGAINKYLVFLGVSAPLRFNLYIVLFMNF